MQPLKNVICKALILNKEFLVYNPLITSALRRYIDYQRVTSQAITLPKLVLVKQSLYSLDNF